MKIEVRTPTRIDLAGGTLDIWPLYILHAPACTVNCTINLFAKVTLESHAGPQIRLESVDLDAAAEFSSLDHMRTTFAGELDDNLKKLKLLASVALFFRPRSGFSLSTHVESPAHSGLGSSSSLFIALCGAFNTLTERNYSKHEMIRIAQDLEASLIKSPTGLQDYYAAMFGGMSKICLQHGSVYAKRIMQDTTTLNDRLVVIFTGVPHDSGMNNWDMFKRRLDNDPEIIQSFENIKRTAFDMADAVTRNDVHSVGTLLQKEWDNRKALSPLVTTPEIESFISVALQAGARSAKVCGAGGGGCVVLFCEEGKKSAVSDAVRAAGAQVLDTALIDTGIQIHVSHTQEH